ncbi:MAG: hypothetical protein ABEJ02_00550 [Candidatus Paceibacteria bacterium]
MKEPVNEFYDISRMPEKPGLLSIYISPSKVENAQSAEKCFEFLELFWDKIKEPEVGVNFIYGDTLYLYSEQEATNLKNKLLASVINHKNKLIKILDNNPHFVKKSVNFTTWNQLLTSGSSFHDYFGRLKKLYNQDDKLQKYIKKDYEENGKRDELDEYQLNFFLEEVLVFYLVAKKELRLRNDFVQGHEEWILNCYPDRPFWSEVYLHQQNPFGLECEENKFENSYYDLENKILYDYNRLDLETMDFSEFS